MIDNFQKIPMGSAQEDTQRIIIEGDVATINGINPDAQGNVSITGSNINTTVAGDTDTVQNHLNTIKNDLGDLGDQTAGIEEKIPQTASSSNQLVDSAGVSTMIIETLEDYYTKTETAEKIDEKISSKIPDAPEDDGSYTLKLTITDGVANYYWKADDTE